MLTKLRLSDHVLGIETGRHVKQKTESKDRIRKPCDTGQAEDEIHFAMDCSQLQYIRRQVC